MPRTSTNAAQQMNDATSSKNYRNDNNNVEANSRDACSRLPSMLVAEVPLKRTNLMPLSNLINMCVIMMIKMLEGKLITM
jgi:hypothetical protein